MAAPCRASLREFGGPRQVCTSFAGHAGDHRWSLTPRCEATTSGYDGRGNRCAADAGHDGPHRTRSGRVRWDDEHEHRAGPQIVDFGATPSTPDLTHAGSQPESTRTGAIHPDSAPSHASINRPETTR